jgi:hypothetical protein
MALLLMPLPFKLLQTYHFSVRTGILCFICEIVRSFYYVVPSSLEELSYKHTTDWHFAFCDSLLRLFYGLTHKQFHSFLIKHTKSNNQPRTIELLR